MSFVRTVLGDVPVETLGVCYAHEHIIIDPSFATYLEPDFLLDSVDLAAKELGELAAAGVTAMVDSMPAACGRNARKLAEVSRRSGIHIVCPTGVHLRKYYPPGHWVDRLAVGELTELFVRDIEDGIDANDYAGPTLSRTAVRAGVIKVATGNAPFSPLEHRAFVAAACAHHQTGCPILTHTDHGAAAHEQCDLLEAEGVRLEHVVLSHVDRRVDLDYHRSLLERGVRLEYDSGIRWPGPANPTIDLLAGLAPEFPSQLLDHRGGTL